MGCKTKLLSGQGQVLGCWVFGFGVFFGGSGWQGRGVTYLGDLGLLLFSF